MWSIELMKQFLKSKKKKEKAKNKKGGRAINAKLCKWQ
jgi:hypothetical protein